MKITRFRDIPQFVRDANYNVTVSWGYLEDHLESWDDRGRTPVITQPPFQRAIVWNDEQCARYVEYILRGGPSSRVIYWNCSSWGKNYNTPIELVDGQQRLNAVRRFLNNEIVVFGNQFKDFTDKMAWTGPCFQFAVNTLQTKLEVLQWYEALNFGGVVHTSEELTKVRKMIEAEKSK